MSHRLIVIALVAVAALSSGCATPETRTARIGSEPREKAGSAKARAPEFRVTTFAGGSFALGEQKGTPVVLNFWESW